MSHFVTPIARCVEDELSNQCGHLTIRWLEVGIIYISCFRDQRLWFNSTSSSPLIFLINLILMDTPFSLCNCRVGPQYPGLVPRAAAWTRLARVPRTVTAILLMEGKQ